jgi:exopolyphosphatase/pppGpp-phosphohydrolase
MPGRTNGRPRTDLVAIVDLGSAAVRFIIARIRPSARYDVVVEERVPTRLGGGAPGTLPARAITKTLRAVRLRALLAAASRGPRVVAIATSAVRDAQPRAPPRSPAARRGIGSAS